MTTIFAKVILDSISSAGIRLLTIHAHYPLIIHAESKAHRIISETGEVLFEYATPGVMEAPELSRNARSARAVPIERIIQEVIDDPFVPLHWGRNQKGMVADEEIYAPVTGFGLALHKVEGDLWPDQAWLTARDHAVAAARAFAQAGYHKQVVNRLLHPFMHIDTLLSATQWNNFFALRIHRAAEPHMRMLAEAIKKAIDESTPTPLLPDEWHLPFIDDDTRVEVLKRAAGGLLNSTNAREFDEKVQRQIDATLRKISVARCARISIAPFDGHSSIDAELERYALLVGSEPLHASPAEHQATPDLHADLPMDLGRRWAHPGLHGNLTGWKQFRKMLINEWVPG